MNIEEIKNETAKQLGENSNLDYITNELLESYEDAILENDEDAIKLDGEELLAGVYCNSVTYDSGPGGYIRYKRGTKGTTNYGCGTDRYKKSKTGTTVRQIGTCGSRTKYLVSW
ncbi:MAG: hypothetical protein ACKVIG_09190 [Flavobacteriales bacterium]